MNQLKQSLVLAAAMLLGAHSDDLETSIETAVSAHNTDEKVYNLAGRRVTSNYRGIVIVRNRKAARY